MNVVNDFGFESKGCAFQIPPAPGATKAVYTISIMQRDVFQLFTHGVYIIIADW
jgi:hypothetical protein